MAVAREIGEERCAQFRRSHHPDDCTCRGQASTRCAEACPLTPDGISRPGCKGQASGHRDGPVAAIFRRRSRSACTLSPSNPCRRSQPTVAERPAGPWGTARCAAGATRRPRSSALSSTSSNAAETASRAVSPSTPIACTCRMTRARPWRRTTRSWRARARAARVSSSAPVDAKIGEGLIDDAVGKSFATQSVAQLDARTARGARGGAGRRFERRQAWDRRRPSAYARPCAMVHRLARAEARAYVRKRRPSPLRRPTHHRRPKL